MSAEKLTWVSVIQGRVEKYVREQGEYSKQGWAWEGVYPSPLGLGLCLSKVYEIVSVSDAILMSMSVFSCVANITAHRASCCLFQGWWTTLHYKCRSLH